MNAYIPRWHQRFRVYKMPNQDVILLGQVEQFFFASNRYPLFHQIDGIRNIQEIAASADSAAQSQQFLDTLTWLQHDSAGLFYDGSPDYRLPGSCRQNGGIRHHGVIDFLSGDFGAELAPWFALLRNESWIGNSVTVICVRDFLDRHIGSILAEVDSPVVLMCFRQDSIMVSPVFPGQRTQQVDYPSSLAFHQFQQRVLSNHPVQKFLATIFVDEDICAPIRTPDFRSMTTAQTGRMLERVANHVYSGSDRLAAINTNGEMSTHAVIPLPDLNDAAYARQLAAPVELHPCPVLFDNDGGSRSMDPAKTLESLRDWISPLTGVIAHMGELGGSSESAIKIYRTLFFKTPPLKDMALLNENSFVQPCLGKGVAPTQSMVSALCEAIERYSAQYQGNEPLHLSRESGLAGRHYSHQQLTPYSTDQYRRFNTHPDSRLKQAAIPYGDEAIHWLPVWSLTDREPVHVPLASCFSALPFDDDQFGRWNSNGCAAGNTLEEAILQGLLELIERDATAIWWYNRVERPAFDMARIDPGHFALLNTALGPDHDFWVLDLTHDVGIPVMAAIARNRTTSGISFGFGCHLRAELAAQRALTELCQLIPIRAQPGASFDFDAIDQQPFLFPANGADPAPLASAMGSRADIKTDIEFIILRLKALKLETLALNYSRAPLPIKAVKVFVPGLCHIWPQFANQRLYQVPVKLGWLESPKSEGELNQHPLYI